jgi:hypothetical protein
VADPRAAALAEYLRQRAADFSWLANLNDTQYTALAGMVLLDAAALAEAMPAGDERLCELSWRHRFTSAPHGWALCPVRGDHGYPSRDSATDGHCSDDR